MRCLFYLNPSLRIDHNKNGQRSPPSTARNRNCACAIIDFNMVPLPNSRAFTFHLLLMSDKPIYRESKLTNLQMKRGLSIYIL